MEWRSNKKGAKGKVESQKISTLETQMKEIINQIKMLQQTIAALSTKDKSNQNRDPLKNPLNQRSKE